MDKTRIKKLLHGIDPAQQVGVEVGALNNPIVIRSMGTIYYIDYATTAELQAKYADDSNVDVSQIVEVDYIWGETSLVEATQGQQPFDYAIASHVIEHVPDLIGWLEEMNAILKTGSLLSLAIPDKRQCFDYKRRLTELSDVFVAYLERRKKPSLHQVFDQWASAVQLQEGHTWEDAIDDPTVLKPYHDLQKAILVTKTALESGAYRDVHCWVFTPYSFLKLLSEIAELGLLKFEVAHFYETTGNEFYVALRAVAAPAAPSLIQATPDDDPQQQLAAANQLLQEQLQEAEAKQQQTEQQLKALAASTQLLQAQLQAQGTHFQTLVQAMESSKFWQMRLTWFKIKQMFLSVD